MSLVNIRFKPGAYQNTEDIGIDGKVIADVMDMYCDEFGNIIKRPGLKTFSSSLPRDIVQGMFFWEQVNLLITIVGGKAYAVNSTGAGTRRGEYSLHNVKNPAIFASDGVKLLVATGFSSGKSGSIGYFQDSGSNMTLLPSGSPVNVSHVAFIDGYFLANNSLSNKVYYAVADKTKTTLTWDTSLQVMSSEYDPDFVVALHVFWNEVYIFGTKTVEVWYSSGDDDFPFMRLQGGLIELGTSAPYTIVKAGGAVYWLDNYRRFVKLTGRQPKSVSNPYQRIFDSFPIVNDATAFAISCAGRNFIVLNFVSANQSFVYDTDLDVWYRWGSWDGMRWNLFRGICSVNVRRGIGSSMLSEGPFRDDASTVFNWATGGSYNWSIGTTAYINNMVRNSVSNHLVVRALKKGGTAPQLPDEAKIVGISVELEHGEIVGTYDTISTSTPNNVTEVRLPDQTGALARWKNLQNGKTKDGVMVNLSMLDEDNELFKPSTYLTFKDFKFNIPYMSQIKGIEVTVYRKFTPPPGTTSSVQDLVVMLTKGGSFIGENKADSSSNWPVGDSEKVYGNTTDDCWGLSLTSNDINSSDFGVGIQVNANAGNFDSPSQFCFIDSVKISVRYTVPNGFTRDDDIRIYFNGALYGVNKSLNKDFTKDEVRRYGGETDDWGYALTPAIVNSQYFGFAVKVAAISEDLCSVSFKKMFFTVYYTLNYNDIFSVTSDFLVGDVFNGRIYSLAKGIFVDDGTTPIRCGFRSGNISHGTYKGKISNSLKLRLKAASLDKLIFTVKDNNKLTWIADKQMDRIADYPNDIVLELHGLGWYHTRQYRLEYMDDSDFIFCEMEEDVEVLE